MKPVIIISIVFVLLFVPILAFADYRISDVENFPDPLKSPDEYIQRYNLELEYKSWFNSIFEGKKIEKVVGYYDTHIEGFPDNSKSPLEYVKRYLMDSTYQDWFKKQFPDTSIRDVLGINLKQYSKILNAIGMEFYEEENDKEAIKYFRQALADDPYNIEAHINAGDSLFFIGDYGTSSMHFNEALKIEENNIHAMLGLAENYLFQEKLTDSINQYAKVLELESENEHALAGFGVVSASLGNASGLEKIEKAISLDPTNIDFLFDKGYALSQLKKYEEAISIYVIFLETYPNDVPTLNNVGYAYENIGEYVLAEEYYKKALEIDSTDEFVVNNFKNLEQAEQKRKDQELPNAINEFLEILNKLKISIEKDDEKNSKKYAQQAITLYENKIESTLPDSPEKRKIEADLEFYKKELRIGEYSKPSLGGGCLIATATYGSELAPQVQQLRELRDNSLLNTETGTNFMNSFNDFYYSFSPIIADYERENPVFREMVKVTITPMISSLSILNYVDINSEMEVLGYGIALIILNLGMYIGIPTIVIVGIRKRKQNL